MSRRSATVPMTMNVMLCETRNNPSLVLATPSPELVSFTKGALATPAPELVSLTKL